MMCRKRIQMSIPGYGNPVNSASILLIHFPCLMMSLQERATRALILCDNYYAKRIIQEISS